MATPITSSITLWRPSSDQVGSKTSVESTSNFNGRKVDFLHIDSESNYFDTREQVRIRNTQWFTETTVASRLSGSNIVTGLFSRKRIIKDDSVYNSTSFATSSVVVDPSGAGRKILALDNDYLASGSIDSYKNGVEISQDKHWTAGIVKISAGTPGHLFDSGKYGVSSVSIVSPDTYVELEVFDPVTFVLTGTTNYPIVTSDYNETENYILNGIIEPFPIRSVVSNFSINFPFEPHSTWGDYGSGNSSRIYGADEVLTVDYRDPVAFSESFDEDRRSMTPLFDVAPFLDAVDLVSMETPVTGVYIGPTQGFVTTDRKNLAPFVDEVYPLNVPPPSSYGAEMIDVLLRMPSGSFKGGTTYVNWKQRVATSGFVYDGSTMGTDSIAFGGRLY